jgi:uncharacterized protein YqcC (DUF446 family)
MERMLLTGKMDEIKAEMKKLGLWKKQAPRWVNDYAERSIATEEDFAGWLQFIYLPNRLNQPPFEEKKHIVPQAVRFFGEDVKKGQLLQLLVELDSLL